MSTKQQVLGNWSQLQGKIKQKWAQLTDDELQEVEGDYDELVGLLQQKTGQTRQEIERMVSKLNEEVGGAVSHATNTAREYVDQAGEKIRGATRQVRRRTRKGYEEAQEMLRRRPTESVAAAFGTGLLVGLLVGKIAGWRSDRWS